MIQIPPFSMSSKLSFRVEWKETVWIRRDPFRRHQEIFEPPPRNFGRMDRAPPSHTQHSLPAV